MWDLKGEIGIRHPVNHRILHAMLFMQIGTIIIAAMKKALRTVHIGSATGFGESIISRVPMYKNHGFCIMRSAVIT